MQDELAKKVNSGLKWNVFNQVVTQVVFVWFGIYLARLLGPKAYGLVGMVTVLSGFANLFVDFGFTSAIIYFKDLNQKKLSSVFWFNLGMAVIIYFIFYLISPYISLFYREPQLIELTQLVTVGIVINSFSSLHNALLSKKIDFKMKVLSSWVSVTVSYAIAFYLAHRGYGVWSLVVQTLCAAFISTLFLWRISKWRPSLYFSFNDIKPLFKYGSSIAGTNILGYLTRNLDNLIVGKFLGNAALGLYARSYSLMMLPVTNISSVFIKVLFPAFSQMQDDLKSLSNYYLKIVQYIALISFPMMFGLCSVAREFVLVFLGPKWVDAIPLIRMLSILGAFQSILSLNGILYNATGNSAKAFKVTLILNGILIPCWLLGIYFGELKGLVFAYVIVGTVGTMPILSFALMQINLKLIDIFNKVKGIMLASISIILINLVFVNVAIGLPLLFCIKVFSGITIYVLLIRILEPKLFKAVKQKLFKFKKRRDFKK